MGNSDELFWNNGVPVAPLESSKPYGTLVTPYRLKPLNRTPLAENLATTAAQDTNMAFLGPEHSHQAKLEEGYKKARERKETKKTIKRSACRLKRWLAKQICCAKQGEEKGPGPRLVDLGDRDDGGAIVWIDEGANCSQENFGKAKRGCRRAGRDEAIITVTEVSGP